MWPRLFSSALRPFPRRLLPRGAAYATMPTPPLRQRGMDEAEALQVELLMPDDGDGEPTTAGATHGTDSSRYSPSDNDAAAETITAVDAFARAKVANFVRRIAGDAPLAALVRAVQLPGETGDSDDSGSGLFHARLPLPVPPEFGSRWGEGLAPTAKEAELVAAMHAERVIDALGLPMFQLTSKQRRHAEAARSAGRWAPLPGDAPRPGTTPSPPRLHLVREGAALAGERRLGIDKIAFVNVTPGAFTPMRLTLASPFLLDHGSVFRVKQFFASYDCTVPRYSRVTALHKPANNSPHKGKGSYGKSDYGSVQVPDGEKMFVAQLRLPIDARFGERIGYGKAPVRRDAIALACMHAELIIDALGLALYPSSRERQAAHAAECRKVNRWCAEPGDCEYHYTRESPPALQMTHSGTQSANCVTATESGRGASLESLLLSHTAAIDAFDSVTEVSVLVTAARREFADYLARYVGTAADQGSPFFIETLGISDHHTYRATATVPVPDVVDGSHSSHTVPSDEVILNSFVAIGISTTEASAEIAASMHALAVLKSLGRQTYEDGTAEQSGYSSDLPNRTCTTSLENMSSTDSRDGKTRNARVAPQPQRLTRATPLPPPYRFVRAHLGRVLVPGLTSPARRATEVSTAQQLAELRSAQAKLPAADWSLAADADSRIVVAPDVSACEGRNYVHTLPAVRRPDAHALVRLRDFLERHGKRPETAVVVSCGETDEGLRRFAATVALPVPATVGRRVIACGEASTEEDARVMCAVHTELLLDRLGVALYDHAGLQCKHSDAARMLGRWAPPPQQAYSPPPAALLDLRVEWNTDSQADAEDTPRDGVQGDTALELPPPVRKEHSDSCVWARLAKASAAARANATLSVATNNTAKSEASSHTALSSAHSVPSLRQPTRDEVKPETGAGNLSDDELCDLSRLTPLHPSEIFRNATRVMEHYCRRHHSDLFRLIRQYSISTPTHGRVHRALLELPLPAAVGRRHAVGVAETKKDALALCCMHATLVLDSLGIALYGDPGRQAAHAAAARARRKSDSSTAPCATGLKSVSSDATDAPPPPPPAPPRADCSRPHVWSFYVRACRSHMAKREAYVLRRALFAERRAPRRGVAVEDAALDAVEALPLFGGARAALPRRCAAAGLPAPPPLRYEPHGAPPARRFLVEQPVAGTPFVARGAGDDGAEAVARAAMHYAYMLDAMAAGSGDGAQPTATAGTRGGSGDPCGTARGALGVMALYAAACAPFRPLRATLREKTDTEKGTVFVALLEYEDASGLRMAGAGEAREADGAGGEKAASLARARAALALCAQLQRHAAFHAVARVARASPALCVETAALFLAEPHTAQPLAAMAPTVPRAPPAWGDGATVLLCRGAADPAMDSSERRALLEVARAHMQSVPAPAPAPPAAARRLFAAMGLCDSDGQCTDVGAAVALLSVCVPPPTHARAGDGGAMPLQLALLLLTGALTHCGPQAARAVAVALTTNGRDGEPMPPLSEYVNTALDEGTRTVLAEVKRRVAALAAALQRAAPTSPLGPLLAHAFPATDCMSTGENEKETEEEKEKACSRICLAIAAAAFPRVFVQRRACAAGRHCVALRPLREGTGTSEDVCVTFPPRLAELSAARDREHCALPMVLALDTTAPTVLGVLVAPAALLLATALGAETSVVDDVPNVVVVDGAVPVVVREAETIAGLLRLRKEVCAHWATLQPLPLPLQRAVDEVFAARHTLTHIAQAGLLLD